MSKTCEVCLTEYEAKRKTSRFCSDKCKLAYHRDKVTVTNDTLTPEIKLSVTDQEFLDYATARKHLGKDWPKFGEERSEGCVNCWKKFNTRLSANRFCSFACRP